MTFDEVLKASIMLEDQRRQPGWISSWQRAVQGQGSMYLDGVRRRDVLIELIDSCVIGSLYIVYYGPFNGESKKECLIKTTTSRLYRMAIVIVDVALIGFEQTGAYLCRSIP